MPDQKHILIVDDEAEIRELLAEALQINGYRVSQAASATAAKRLVGEDRPDLVITDLQLEQSDGLMMIDEIKALHPGLPALLLTGIIFDEKSVEERIRRKVSAYLPKTSPLKAVLAEAARLLGP